ILPLEIGHIRDARGIRRIGRCFTAPHRQNFRNPAFDGYGIQTVKVRVGFARRTDQDLLAVRGPPDNDVGVGMPGKALWFTAFGGHDVGVDIAVVLAREGNPTSIWREFRPGLVAASRKLARFATFSRYGPQ